MMTGESKFDVGLGLEGVHVLCTGGAGLIGRGVVEAFLAAGELLNCFMLTLVRYGN